MKISVDFSAGATIRDTTRLNYHRSSPTIDLLASIVAVFRWIRLVASRSSYLFLFSLLPLSSTIFVIHRVNVGSRFRGVRSRWRKCQGPSTNWPHWGSLNSPPVHANNRNEFDCSSGERPYQRRKIISCFSLFFSPHQIASGILHERLHGFRGWTIGVVSYLFERGILWIKTFCMEDFFPILAAIINYDFSGKRGRHF